jgi:opacity protein-like surface antigen
MAAATMGYQLNPNAGIYGLAGLSGSRIEVPSLASASTLSLVLGAGVNLDIGQTGWSAFAEYNRIQARGVDLGGVNVKADENLVRAGVRFKLGN